MILLIAIPAAFIAATLIAGFLYEMTVAGNIVDRWLAHPEPEPDLEPDLVYELADLYDIDITWMMDGDF